MKIFNREFWGTVLIWLGVLLFLLVIYDLTQPFFPQRAPYPLIQTIQDFFSRGTIFPQRTAAPHSPPAARSGRQPARQPLAPLEGLPADQRLLTNGAFSPGNQYQQWVWAVKPEYRTGATARVEMAHAAPGKNGGFFIVAYADTDGDGKPDREVAKSEFLTAEKPGQWSQFTFPAGESPLFVGNFWGPDQDTVIFRGNGDWPEENFPLQGRFFYQVSGGNSRSAGPAHTNLRISFSD